VCSRRGLDKFGTEAANGGEDAPGSAFRAVPLRPFRLFRLMLSLLQSLVIAEISDRMTSGEIAMSVRPVVRAGLLPAYLIALGLWSGTFAAPAQAQDYYYVITKVRAQPGGTGGKWYDFKETSTSGLAWRLIANIADWPLVVTLEVTWERFGTKKDLYPPELTFWTSVFVDGLYKGSVNSLTDTPKKTLRWYYYYYPKAPGTHTIYMQYAVPGTLATGFPSTIKIVPRFKLGS
jgi:hypothetical protein